MEVKPMAQAPVIMAAPAPVVPMAPIMEKPHDHIHLHASYKHTAIVLPEVKPIAHVPVAPVAFPTSAASILVLFILLVIIARSFRC
jgi:hypothetical protein